MNEFKLLDEEANVYKLIGPILAKQSLFDCKNTVQQRLDFIDKEVTRFEALETEFSGKISDKTTKVKKI